MKISKVALGNNEEAFIENRFTTGTNIISSDDNNKGKTIVIQSALYALGNDPIFPSSFPFRNYYHIVECELENGETFSICRKDSSFVMLYKSNISLFDSVSELKYFINKMLFNIPVIIKDGLRKVVDPLLFYQIFFVGQDKKNTSTIFQNGYYTKQDFINMLFSYCGICVVSNSEFDEDEIKTRVQALKSEKSLLQKQNKILKTVNPAVALASLSNSNTSFEEKLKKIEKLKKEIISLQIKRNLATSRKVKNEIALKELRSLNQSLSVGQLHCLDCDSTNIGYSTADNSCSFDISSIEIRRQIISSVEDKIAAYSEEVNDITSLINEAQEELKLLLSSEDVSLEALFTYKTELTNAAAADTRIVEIDKEIKELQVLMETKESTSKDIELKKEQLLSAIIQAMNSFYRAVDPQGNLVFDDLFSKKNDVYSGCEGTEFYLAKLFALNFVLQHKFPIIMDYFRDGELSSIKEDKVLELFNKCPNQKIFTATLKNQELGKYDGMDSINHINYMSHTASHLLKKEYVEDFIKEMRLFSISL